jgi:signal transduction histidine kinase/CheY-like chemotaxis protein
MTATKAELTTNLGDLRGQLAGRMALLLMGVSALGMWLAKPGPEEPVPAAFGLWTALLALSLGAWLSVGTRPALARRLLIWGLTACLLAAMGLYSDPWLPFLGLLLTFIGALLVSAGELVTAGAVTAMAVWLTYSGARAYPLSGLLMALALGVALAWLVMRTLYTALEWAWTMQQQANHLLEVARDHQGKLSATLKSLDLANTLLRRTQRELVFARKQADEARRMKEQFAANVSHELRTPLNLILGFSELMYLWPDVYGELSWPPNLRRAVHQIYHSSHHLLEMIDDILDLSRLEMVGFTLNKELTPLEPLLHGAAEIVEDLFRSVPVRLEVEIAPGLPALEIDRTRIRQVLLNLLNNARRFTEAGKVRLAAVQVDGEVIVSVSDTGRGIPADKLAYIFDEFYQVDHSLHRSHGGVGLGLAISKRFVEAHEGRIWVESQEGRGSTFFFSLPVPDYYSPLSSSHMENPVEPSWPADTRPSIVVVDPDPIVAAWIGRHIEEYEVMQVAEVDRLAEAVMLHHPQAVVWNVPPGERRANEDLPALPVPFVECSLPSQAWVADDLAVTACLTKPVTAERFLAELDRLGSVHDVLIVDDDRGFCELVGQMLETTGRAFDLRRAYDGAEGLQAMRARRPDLLLLDLIMPDVDGFEVLAEMRREPGLAELPVVLLTATSLADDALAQRDSQMVIGRSGGLRPAEVLRCLRAVVGVLEPHYDERSAPEESLAERTA